MSETASQQTGGSEGNPEAAAAASGVPGDGAAAVQVPAGYVPQSELEKARQTAAGLQSQKDRLQAELDKLRSAPAPAASEGSGSASVDVHATIGEAVAAVYRAGEMRDAAASLKSEFKYADPTLFESEKLAGFDSPESLRLVVEASHKRVADILAAETAGQTEEQRQAAAAASAGASDPSGASTPAASGDPTIEQLAGMTPGEFAALPEGVVERVLAKAEASA